MQKDLPFWACALSAVLFPPFDAPLFGAPRDRPPAVGEPLTGQAEPPVSLTSQPNIIFILTDDQRWDSLPGIAPDHIPQNVMPSLERELIEKGVLFRQAFVTSPICCPARASLLSGGFCAASTGVLWNHWPNGGIRRFHDAQTLATLLQDRGYKTGLIGKYLNMYGVEQDGYDEDGNYIPASNYVPPGWSVWLGMLNQHYHRHYKIIVGASSAQAPAAGLKLPDDVRLPNDVSALVEFLHALELNGFPASMLDLLWPLYTQPGDFTHDGNINLDDYAELTACLSGPSISVEPQCGVFDFDTDTDVDLADFASFQLTADPALGGMPRLIDFYTDAALAFIEPDRHPRLPFFLLISTVHPHDPALPDEQDQDLFPGFEYRGRAWGEADLSDKPPHLRNHAEPRFSDYYDGTRPFAVGERGPDQYFADQLRCLRAVDRMIDAIVTAIEEHDVLRENTVFVFASDNGDMWGEHKQFNKGKPYEESIRVPLVIRLPNMEAVGTSDELVAMDLDVPATILELAGYTRQEIEEVPLSEGMNLLGIMRTLGDPNPDWREHLLLQLWRPAILTMQVAWAAIREAQWKYIQYDYVEGSGVTEELYDLQADPHELESLHESAAYQDIKEKLRGLLEQEMGLMITGMAQPWGDLPDGANGVEYRHALGARGGTAPYHWSLYTKSGDGDLEGLPDGVQFSPDGVISGIPMVQPGAYDFEVRVEDSSASPHHGGPQSYVVRLRLRIR